MALFPKWPYWLVVMIVLPCGLRKLQMQQPSNAVYECNGWRHLHETSPPSHFSTHSLLLSAFCARTTANSLPNRTGDLCDHSLARRFIPWRVGDKNCNGSMIIVWQRN